MDVRLSGHRVVRCAVAFLLGTVASGCQSTSGLSAVLERVRSPFTGQTAPAVATQNPKTLPLVQGMEISWNVKLAKEEPGVVTAGKSAIGPDGQIELGPYGSCKVAGMNINQAAHTVEKHLAAYLTRPGVRLSTVVPSNNDTVAWRPSDGTVQTNHQIIEPKNENSALPAAGQGIQPVARKQRVYPSEHAPPHGRSHHGSPMPTASMVPSAPGENSRIPLPTYVVGQPDVLQIESLKGLLNQPVRGPHLIRPDGTVGIGAYGSAKVAGLTLEQAREEIAKVIHAKLNKDVVKIQEVLDGLSVDVLAYNSKVYYVITDGGGYGEQVVRIPVTGNDFVLDGISYINGLPAVASKKHIWVARSNPGAGAPDTILPVDWIGITQRGATATNYQIMPGDRIYVRADRWRTADAFLAKVLAPVERLMGITLLSSQTVNSIRTGQTGFR